MQELTLREFIKMSTDIGSHADFVQGGGGNTSVKLDDSLMAVKASGFNLKDMTEKKGYVVVKYKDIVEYYNNVDLNSGIDYENNSTAFTRGKVVPFKGTEKYRPSVEAGFHSLLKKYVIHTHSVYANILCCSEEGRSKAEDMLKSTGLSWLWLPYVDPGFSLTYMLKEKIDALVLEKGEFPRVIFMQNHGLIVNDDTYEGCLKLHGKVNELIKDFLDIKMDFPEIIIDELDENKFASKTPYVMGYLKGNNFNSDFFNKYVLYPDQLVYFNGNIGEKIRLDIEKEEIEYNASFKEANAFEETLVSYLYVIDMVKKSGLTLSTMTKEQIAFINGWESEKYRKKLLKNE